MAQPTRINLHPNEYRKSRISLLSFAVKLDRCVGLCNVKEKCVLKI